LTGSCTAVSVTGNGFGFVIVATTSPVPPGYSRLDTEGVATAVIVRFWTLADWLSPLDPAPRLTTQLDAANAPPPANRAPIAAAAIVDRRVQNLLCRWFFCLWSLSTFCKHSDRHVPYLLIEDP
jgi:hypothetical protein